jgi:hypothetical protein
MKNHRDTVNAEKHHTWTDFSTERAKRQNQKKDWQSLERLPVLN